MNLHEILEQLRDPKPTVRREAIIALAHLAEDDPEMRQPALVALAEVYRGDPIPELRKLARKAGKHVTALDEAPIPDAAVEETPPPYTTPASGEPRSASNPLIQARRFSDQRATSEQPTAPRPSKAPSSDALIPSRRLGEDKYNPLPRKPLPPAEPAYEASKAEPTTGSALGGLLVIGGIVAILVVGFLLIAASRVGDAALTQMILNNTRELESARYGRPYYLFIPEGQPPAGGFPAVIALHGYNQTGADMIRIFAPACAEHDAILIAMNIDWQPNRIQTYFDDILNDVLDTVYERDQVFNISRGGPILLGYGPGADYAAYFAADYSYDFAGVMLLGIRPLQSGSMPLPARTDLPYRISSGDRDNGEPFASRYASNLQAQGNPVIYEIIENNGPEISSEQADILGEFLADLYGG